MAGSITRDAESSPLTDDELVALALAADPDTAVDDDAVCLWDLARPDAVSLLPEWYMPSAPGGPGRLTGWRRRVARVSVSFVIASFLVINAYGLCNTYGQLNFG
jgi:hypothetical protein